MNIIQFLNQQLVELESYICKQDKEKATVSKANVAWHIDHSLKTINRIYDALEGSDPNTYRSSFSFSKLWVFALGDFPRGIAKAPKAVRPPKEIIQSDLFLQLKEAHKNLIKLEQLDGHAYFEHPYFKTINKRQSIRFLKIHTGHHLKIIRDILK